MLSSYRPGGVDIANYFALASAAKFAEGRGATTSQVLKHLASSAYFQAEASAKS